jgi:hypothetical protein
VVYPLTTLQLLAVVLVAPVLVEVVEVEEFVQL